MARVVTVRLPHFSSPVLAREYREKPPFAPAAGEAGITEMTYANASQAKKKAAALRAVGIAATVAKHHRSWYVLIGD